MILSITLRTLSNINTRQLINTWMKLITLSSLIIWKLTAHSSEDSEILVVLNKTYQKERPFEARISGFNYAPVNNLRGGTPKGNSDSVARKVAEGRRTGDRKPAKAEFERLILLKRRFLPWPLSLFRRRYFGGAQVAK